MKKAFFLIALLLCSLVLLIPLSAQAHPGRTDSSGGHYDRSTGEYHYHHGYPPHQHIDGICPYDFDDKTGPSSGSSSGSSSNSSFGSSGSFSGVPYDNDETATPQSSKDDSPSVFKCLFLGSMLLAAIMFITHKLANHFPTIKKSLCNKSNIKNLLLGFTHISTALLFAYFLYHSYPFFYFLLLTILNIILCYIIMYFFGKQQLKQERQEEKTKIRKYEERQKFYSKEYAGKSVSELSGAPSGSYLNQYGLPTEIGKYRWGKYTFCYSPKSKIYHTINCRYAKTSILINALEVRRKRCTPCKICKPQLPDLSWVEKYKNIQQIKEKYHIDIKNKDQRNLYAAIDKINHWLALDENNPLLINAAANQKLSVEQFLEEQRVKIKKLK